MEEGLIDRVISNIGWRAYLKVERTKMEENKEKLFNKTTFYRMAKVTTFVLLLTLFTMICVVIILQMLLDGGTITMEDLKPLMFVKITVWDILVFSTMEEIVFRKLILGYLEKRKLKYSNAIQAFLFAAVHGNLFKIPNTFLSGLIYGNVYLKEKRVIYTIILHLIKNFGVIIITEYFSDIIWLASLYVLVAALCICGIGLYLIWKSIDIKLFSLKGINHI